MDNYTIVTTPLMHHGRGHLGDDVETMYRLNRSKQFFFGILLFSCFLVLLVYATVFSSSNKKG